MARWLKSHALNAQVEGMDVLDDEEPRHKTRIPVAYDEIFRRLDAELRLRDYALLAVPQPRRSPLDEPGYDTFIAQMKPGGRVEKCDLLKVAREHDCIGETESPVARWTNIPASVAR
jgi:hypothetical protein